MKKIYHTFHFFRTSDYLVKGKLLFALISFPAFCFHELCHALALIFTAWNVTILEIKGRWLESNGPIFTPYELAIRSASVGKTGLLCDVLISGAPAVGILLSWLLSPYLTLYLILTFKISWLSSVDSATLQASLVKIGLPSDHVVIQTFAKINTFKTKVI